MSGPFEYCDLHSHLLPGIDDGCQNLPESLECLRELSRAGCRQVACTPHMGLPQYRDNVPSEIGPLVQRLQRAAETEGLEIEIIAGGEFRLIEDSIPWWQQFGVPILGESKVVLLDTWEEAWPDYLDRAIEWLLSEAYQPVLAHPERMRLPDTLWQATLDQLLDRVCCCRVTSRALETTSNHVFSEEPRRCSQTGRYHCLASDSHGPTKPAGPLVRRRLATRQSRFRNAQAANLAASDRIAQCVGVGKNELSR